MKYDLETLLNETGTFLKTNLNAKLAAIDAEKADGITLTPFDDNAYMLQTFNNKLAAYNPLLLYGVDKTSTNTDSRGNVAATTYTLSFVVILADAGQDPTITNQIFRYQRALLDLFEENWSQIGSFAQKMKVETLEPVAFRLMDSPNDYRAVGVSLQAVIA